MHGFTYQPDTGRWYKPEAGGIWYDPQKGEYFSVRLQVWTVGRRWPSTADPFAPVVPATPPAQGSGRIAANALPWTLDGREDPMLSVRDKVWDLPRLDRVRLIAWVIDELDEPDDKAGFEDFRDRVRRAGLRWEDRAGIYRLFGERVPEQGATDLSELFKRGIGAFSEPANSAGRPRIRGKGRR
jgi:hypothetical protein